MFKFKKSILACCLAAFGLTAMAGTASAQPRQAHHHHHHHRHHVNH